MFRKALSIVSNFTLPVLLSRKTARGKCEGTVGTCVVINRDGWIVTAAHLLRQWNQLQADVQSFRDFPGLRKSIEDNQTISRQEKRKRLADLRGPNPDSTDQCSAFWGIPGSVLMDIAWVGLSGPGWDELVDIGIGRLVPFDPNSVSAYPRFKRDSQDIDDVGPGTSLCKLGFPFCTISPTWNGTGFILPAIPFTRFPIDGIFTRNLHIQVVDPHGGPLQTPFPVKYLETSTPGLKGQSGGPIFDVGGVIWAIQAKTVHLPLGFDAKVPGRQGHSEHQFLNVGLGVHPTTLLGFLRDRNVAFELADY
jgi:hypothetical protein